MSKVVLKKAFTLLELIIVIFLLSLLSFMVVGNIRKAETKKETVGIANIKNLVDVNGYYELICIDKCKSCLLVDKTFKFTKVPSQFGKIKAYILDSSNQMSRIDFGRLKDSKICFRFIFYPNGSTSKMVVESKGEFYYIPSYFGKIKKFNSLSEAFDYWRQDRYLLRGMGDFY